MSKKTKLRNTHILENEKGIHTNDRSTTAKTKISDVTVKHDPR